MRRALLVLVPTLVAAGSVSAQAPAACDPGQPFECAASTSTTTVGDAHSSHRSMWVMAAPAGAAVAAAWLSLSAPGVFASHPAAVATGTPAPQGSGVTDGPAGSTVVGFTPGTSTPSTPSSPSTPSQGGDPVVPQTGGSMASAAVAVTPEPASIALLATGLLALMGLATRRRGSAGRAD